MIPWQLRYPFMWAVVRHESLLDRLPEGAQRWLAKRAMRDTMASWGLPVGDVSDELLVEGIQVVGRGTSVRTRAAAVALFEWLRDNR